MSNLKIGDFVYFSLNDSNGAKLFTKSGIVINKVDEPLSTKEIIYILDGSFTNSIYKVIEDNVKHVSERENIISEINVYYDTEINKIQSQMKSIKRIDYKDELISKYLKLKEEILNTAKNMISSIDDEDFESKLKAISLKKKQLFEIECEDINNARKHNGEMKYRIKELNKKRENDLRYMDISIDKLKKQIGLE